jgi:UDP-N-acetylglucosamine 2-epimerase
VGRNSRGGTNRSCRHRKGEIAQGAKKVLKTKRDWKHPIGNGKAGERILNILLRKHGAVLGLQLCCIH